jgi:hypothetical protein
MAGECIEPITFFFQLEMGGILLQIATQTLQGRFSDFGVASTLLTKEFCGQKG